MFQYILLSCLLSLVGGVFYFGFLRKQLNAEYSKYSLIAIIGLCLLLPFMVATNSTPLIQEASFDAYTYNEWNVVDISDPKLKDCYTKSQNSKDFCHCEIVQKSEILAYQPNPVYDFIAKSKAPVFYLICIIAILFFIDLLLKFGYLIYVVCSSPKTKHTLAGTTFYLLRPANPNLPVSSFTLFHNYIIWTTSLDQGGFSQEEQDAILLHEVAHLKQKDTWQQLLMHIVRMFWWMTPMFYLFRRELDRLNEFVADEFAVGRVGNVRLYASLLIRVKEQQQATKPVMALSFAKSLLHRRIVRLLDKSKTSNKNSNPFLLSLFFATAMLWGTGLAAQSFLQNQTVAFEQYEILKQESHKTGKQYFCKDCLIKSLNKKK